MEFHHPHHSQNGLVALLSDITIKTGTTDEGSASYCLGQNVFETFYCAFVDYDGWDDLVGFEDHGLKSTFIGHPVSIINESDYNNKEKNLIK